MTEHTACRNYLLHPVALRLGYTTLRVESMARPAGFAIVLVVTASLASCERSGIPNQSSSQGVQPAEASARSLGPKEQLAMVFEQGLPPDEQNRRFIEIVRTTGPASGAWVEEAQAHTAQMLDGARPRGGNRLLKSECFDLGCVETFELTQDRAFVTAVKARPWRGGSILTTGARDGASATRVWLLFNPDR